MGSWRLALPVLALLSMGVRGNELPADGRIARVENQLLPAIVTDRTVPMRLSDRMRAYRIPGLSVAVVDKGQLAWAHAWGVAQAGFAQPLRTDTLLQAASISKSLTALGVLRLADQGRLALDQDVGTLLRRWHLPAGAQTPDHPVTVRRILSHTAGLSTHGFEGYLPGAPLPTMAQILDGAAPANSEPVRVTLRPGSQWRYSGGGYVLLQQMIEDVTGETFAGWMQRNVLAPTGMAASMFGTLPDAPLDQAAVGHVSGRPIEGGRASHPEYAAAGLWTTPSDLARLSIALQRILGGEASAVLRTTTLDEALHRVGDTPSGLGFFVEDGDQHLRYGHDGANRGFEAHWRFDRDRAVILMANDNDASRLYPEIVRAIAVAHGWSDLQPQHLDAPALAALFSGTPLYLRGSMNGWGTDLPLRQAGRGRFAVDLDLPAQPVEFKFASEDWHTLDLGSLSADLPGKASGELAFGIADNVRFNVKTAGCYRFTLDVRDARAPRYRIKRLTNGNCP